MSATVNTKSPQYNARGSATVVDPIVQMRMAMNKVASVLNNFIRSMGVSDQLCMKTTDWDDCSRVQGSCWGDNITDVKLELLRHGVWYPLHTMGSNNFDPVGVYVALKDLNLTVCNPNGEEQRTVDAFTVLNDPHGYFPHKVDEGTCLSTDPDETAFYKVQVVFVPCNDDGQSEANVATKARNYQAAPNRPRNFVIYGWAEGCDAHTDDPEGCTRERLYCATEVSKADGKSHRFLTTTDVSPRTVAQSGTETKEQAEAALAAGKAIERKMGPADADKHGGCVHVQVPIEQTQLTRRVFTPAVMIAAAMGDPISPAPPAPKKPKYTSLAVPPDEGAASDKSVGSVSSAASVATVAKPEPVVAVGVAIASSPPTNGLNMGAGLRWSGPGTDGAVSSDDDDDDAGTPQFRGASAGNRFRSCAADVDDDPPPTYRGAISSDDAPMPAAQPRSALDDVAADLAEVLPADPAVNCKMGRTKKGPHHGVDRPLAFSNLKRDTAGGVITFTETMYVCIDEDKEPTDEDATQVYKLMAKRILAAVNRGGKVHNLQSDFAKALGHTTESLSMEGAQGIAATLKAAGKASLSVDLFG